MVCIKVLKRKVFGRVYLHNFFPCTGDFAEKSEIGMVVNPGSQ